MIVLGIDPGSRRTGWGVIRAEGNRLVLVAAGVVAPPTGDGMAPRLAALQAGLRLVLDEHRPDRVGIETVFHGVNVRSLVTLGQARGALVAELGARRLSLVELSPAEVKKAVTGRGAATKDQVAHMVGAILGPAVREFSGSARKADATDALAVALAAHHRSSRAALERLGG